MKQALANLLSQALQNLVADGTLVEDPNVTPQIDHTKDPSHGDLATNLAMVLAKHAKMSPRDLAARILLAIPENAIVEKTDIAGPGFINFFVTQASNTQAVNDIFAAGRRYGCTDIGQGKRVQVEFVSANPTGPLHVGHGRGAAIGDALCRLLKATGWHVHSEFYYNDAGQQINNLALSVKARALGQTPDDAEWPEDGYRGEYITDLAQA